MFWCCVSVRLVRRGGEESAGVLGLGVGVGLGYVRLRYILESGCGLVQRALACG